MIIKINQITGEGKSAKLKEIFKKISDKSMQTPEKWLQELNKKEIGALRKELKELNSTKYEVLFKKEVHKKSRYSLDYSSEYSKFPTHEELRLQLEDFKSCLKSFRKDQKTNAVTQRTFMNGAIKYSMMGNNNGGYVFTQKNSVTKLIGPDFRLNIASQHKTPDPRVKGNFVGIELEICSFLDYTKLNKLMANERLHSYVNVGTDGSIRPDHGDKGQLGSEIRILCKEEEVSRIVPKVLAILKRDEVGAYVNSSCGFHVHLDARSRDVNHMYNNLVKSLPILNAMVPQERISGNAANKYCKQNDTPNFAKTKELGQNSRYQAINPASFDKQKTIEVRLHSGTVNTLKIINWVNILTSIVNHDKLLYYKISSVEDFKTINPDKDLTSYMDARISKFNKLGRDRVDTSMDEITDELLEKMA